MSRAHRLAAIMFTDIQGYTKLMQEDEDGAVEIRRRHREVFQSTTSNNHGEIIQYYGDGTLSIFESCVDAVRCAKEMQSQFQSDPAIPVRVGIHLGDIILSDDDIIGNSVNVAARVESLGIPGSVLISHKVFDEIRNKQEFSVVLLGEFHFKNDRAPRKIYAVSGPNLIIPRRHELQGKLESKKSESRSRNPWLWMATLLILILGLWGAGFEMPFFKGSIKSLAVLPLYDRIGLDDSENYIIEGLHEEIITKLAKVGLNVKPYSTMRHYRDSPKTPEIIAEELSVDGLVEGSVFRNQDLYRFRVLVIESNSLNYLADPYEAEAKLSSVVSVFAKLVEAIANQIDHVLTPEAEAYLLQNQVIDSAAYDLYLRGRWHLNRGSTQDLQLAIDLFNESLSVDSTFVDPHVSLVESYLLSGFSSTSPKEELDRFRHHLALATDLDPFFSKDPHLMAMVKIFDNWDWPGAIAELKKSMKSSPKSWEPYDSYCQLMWAVGDMDESIAAGKKSVDAEPNAHFAHCDLAWAYFFNKDYDMSRQTVDHIFQKFEGHCPHHSGLSIFLDINSKMKIGQSLVPVIDQIAREVDTIGNPVYNLSLLGYAHALEGNRDEAMEILQEMESRNIPGAVKIYVALGDHDKALDLLDASISNRSFFQMYAIKQAPWFDPLRGDPRFRQILRRMGLADDQLN